MQMFGAHFFLDTLCIFWSKRDAVVIRRCKALASYFLYERIVDEMIYVMPWWMDSLGGISLTISFYAAV